jgi:hypothetical protein
VPNPNATASTLDRRNEERRREEHVWKNLHIALEEVEEIFGNVGVIADAEKRKMVRTNRDGRKMIISTHSNLSTA